MNEALEKIGQREFGDNEFIIGGIKKGKIHQFAGKTTKKNFKESMERLRGILRE